MCSRDVEFETMGSALGPKSDPAGLLHGLNAKCWAQNEQPISIYVGMFDFRSLLLVLTFINMAFIWPFCDMVI